MSVDHSELELRRERAVAHLDLYERVLASLSAKVAHLHQALDDAGERGAWDALNPLDIEGREAILRRMRHRGQWP